MWIKQNDSAGASKVEYSILLFILTLSVASLSALGPAMSNSFYAASNHFEDLCESQNSLRSGGGFVADFSDECSGGSVSNASSGGNVYGGSQASTMGDQDTTTNGDVGPDYASGGSGSSANADRR